MRTTVRIDDELLEMLKQRALESKLPLGKLLNQVIRRGLEMRPNVRPAKPFRQPVSEMGALMNLDKASSIAAMLEDEELARKLALRK